jgi:hypothetical protein
MPSSTQELSSIYYIISAAEWLKKFSLAPLNKLGWVYQEQKMVRFKIKLFLDIT